MLSDCVEAAPTYIQYVPKIGTYACLLAMRIHKDIEAHSPRAWSFFSDCTCSAFVEY
jgi:hypothetical protein